MSTSTKLKQSQKGASTSELINVRFYENQKRQALTTTDDSDVDQDKTLFSGGNASDVTNKAPNLPTLEPSPGTFFRLRFC